MKNFLTKEQSCKFLQNMNEDVCITKNDAIKLKSIKVCIAAESMGFNLWGVSVEEARPLFRDCEIPDENSDEDIINNYEVYKKYIKEVREKLAI